MKKYIFTESQLKKIIDTELDERSRSLANTRKKRLFPKSAMMSNPDRFKEYDKEVKNINEQYEEKIVEEINKMGPIKLFSDSSEKNLIGQTYFSESFKNPDGSINLYPKEIKFSSPLGSKSGWKLLTFKCGVNGLKSSGNGTVVYNKQLQNYLINKFCGKTM